ncbi:MAG: methyltransferase domain-containing protein [Acidobacteria bacterium]|nr:methyltransferase domain-containing protein [Acidobacteriota bacterium]
MSLPAAAINREPSNARDKPEFDRYASDYDELLTDPARDYFAKDPLHFHKRKWDLMQRLLKRAGVDAASLRWLDVGCGRGELLGLAGGHFAEAMGCDPSPAMLSACANFKNREFKETLQVLQRHRVKYVVWNTHFQDAAVSRLFPSAVQTDPASQVIEPYLETHYRQIWADENNRLMELKSDDTAVERTSGSDDSK